VFSNLLFDEEDIRSQARDSQSAKQINNLISRLAHRETDAIKVVRELERVLRDSSRNTKASQSIILPILELLDSADTGNDEVLVYTLLKLVNEVLLGIFMLACCGKPRDA
jgi:hypothetical protein